MHPEVHPISPNNNTNNSNSHSHDAAGSFECNICFELAQDPIVTLCGHLFCWPCLYKWLHVHAQSQECPVCKSPIEEHKLVPLYGRGKTSTDPRSRSIPDTQIPNRPTGQRPVTAPMPDPNHFPPLNNPWNNAGAGPNRFGNYPFSAGIGGLFPYLNFQVHGFNDVGAYGGGLNNVGYPYGFGAGSNTGAFNGALPHGFHHHHHHHRGLQGQQADVYLKALLILVAALVIATLFLS